MWQKLIRRKYLKNNTLSQVTKKPGDSHFWSGLMDIKDKFLSRGRFLVHNGEQIRFWENVWLGNQKLKDRYSCLYNIVRRKNDTVENVLSTVPLKVSFRRAQRGSVLNKWLELVTEIIDVNLNDQKDVFIWGLGRGQKFSVKSMYADIMKQYGVHSNCTFWKLRVPLKIKIFSWYLWKGLILAKDNLAKRNWRGSLKCCFCNADETIQHLFFGYHVARNIWNLIFITFGIQPPTSFSHILGSWLRGFSKSLKNQCTVGTIALCWAIWLNRNEVVFRNTNPNSFVQVINEVVFRNTNPNSFV
jgi:hypothetical protein